jgi:hypothetical protein
MRTWNAATTVEAPAEIVFDALTDPDAVARWSPVEFELEQLDSDRLETGSCARVSGRLAGVDVGFDVEVLEAEDGRLFLTADGPVALDVAYDLVAVADGSSEVRASVGVRPGRGFRGRILAEATTALLRAGALQAALARIGREVAPQYALAA